MLMKLMSYLYECVSSKGLKKGETLFDVSGYLI
jgi:hypothetical protein